MSGAAIAMMLVMTLAIWGGLVLAIIWLVRNDRRTEGDQAERAAPEHLNRDL